MKQRPSRTVLVLALLVTGCASQPREVETAEPVEHEIVMERSGQSSTVRVTPVEDSDPQPPVHMNPADPPAPTILQPFPGVRVLVEDHQVELAAISCLDVGWLEQIACAPNTREHESLLVVIPEPSQVHAAMLMAGFEPGKPGSWQSDDSSVPQTGGGYKYVPPTGDPVEILVRYETAAGVVEHPIRQWIRGQTDADIFPRSPWVFAGSIFAENPEFMGPGEHYVADMTGSVIGLVTFGDEVIGWTEALQDQDEFAAPAWRVRESAVAPFETEVTLILRKPSSHFAPGE